VAAGALAACDAPRPATPALWTLFDVQALYDSENDPSYAIATDAGLPGGIPLSSILAPNSSTLSVLPGWAESYPVAYVTTEVWSHFGPVWAQPMYVPITGWSNGDPSKVIGADQQSHPIFSVGPGSRFYSPFWQMIYVVVPSTTQDGELTSVRQILDAHYPLVPSTGWVAALSPGDVHLDPAAAPPSGGANTGTGWLDGAPIAFVSFPQAPFGVDADLVVAEVPIYHFIYRKDDGSVVTPPIPSVLGTGPPYSHTPPPLDPQGNLTAKYSAYWRLYTVLIPSTARVFAPPVDPFMDLANQLDVAGIPKATYGMDITAATPGLAAYVGRVALNPTCFGSAANLLPREGPDSCVYLDSQPAIEASLAQGAILPTDITVTCPLVSVRGVAVGP
jgi:hypothetical protein